MKSNLLSIIVTCLLFVNAGYAQEKPFEGIIRQAASIDFDQLIKNTNKLADANTGNKSADIMVKKSVDEQLGGLNEVLSTINGQFESLIKVKGNKLAQFKTQDGSVLLIDCDKGEIFMTYPFAKLGLKYTITEYQQMTSAIKYDINMMQDNIQELGGYQCKKEIVSCKMNGKETSSSEYWYTDKIILPKCYLETLHLPGLVIVEETKMLGNPMYILVTEINRIEISNENFIIPKDYEILTSKDYIKFSKKLNDAAKNKKTYAVGSKIPDVFWDF